MTEGKGSGKREREGSARPEGEGKVPDVQLRVLASAILYRATLRALPRAPTAEEKMRLHARVEERAWDLPADMIAEVDGRDVDDGPPESEQWRRVVTQLAGAAP